ncbi:hypothetical protein ACFFX1_29605 [Dactylosporangium sucinum]|uniref:DUF7144 domain-containing protein n=1 Tax=Dactylosporangium sucinum TaxID=1424081 RepID=A0A917UDR1_9ACTN|nr:hypothetical protein [Dactylosporangium sucinum]GGM85842.1 hypothetical protein GCM10007977_104580 [Dactylosporangium sucinum]
MADSRTARPGTAWFGWITFAAVLLVVIGLLNILEGLVALLRRTVTFIDGDSLVVVDLTGLGVVMLVFGALLLAAGIGLMARNAIARIAAIVIVAIHAIVQVGSLGAYPVWSLLMITLDVIILFALTVHWSDATAAVGTGVGSHRMTDRDQQQPRFPVNAPATGPTAAPGAPGTPGAPGAPGAPGSSSWSAPAHAAPDVPGSGSAGSGSAGSGSAGSGSAEPGPAGHGPAHAAPDEAYQQPEAYQPPSSQAPPSAPNAGPYPPNRPSSPAHAAPTSGHGTGAADDR